MSGAAARGRGALGGAQAGDPPLPPPSLEQLGFNALLQLMIGVPLEMVHGLLRISLLYLAGVLAGEQGRGRGLASRVPCVLSPPRPQAR